MQIDPVPEISDILRALVGDAGHVVLVDEHDGGMVIVRGCQFLYIDHEPVGDAPCALKPGAALAFFEAFGSVPLPPYIQRVAAASDRERYQSIFAREPGDAAGRDQAIESK